MPAMRRGGVIAVLSVVGLAAMALGGYALRGAATRRGEQLFHGTMPLAGRITGQTEALPVKASRCVNCHGATPGSGPAPPFAPRLDAGFLTRPHSRRGGPASRYDERTFCVLLRSGVDPAYVIIPQEMPRYELSAQDCNALWQFSLSQ